MVSNEGKVVVENLSVYAALGTNIPANSGAITVNLFGTIRNIYAEVTFTGDSANNRGALIGLAQGSDAMAACNSLENVVVKVSFDESVTNKANIGGILTMQPEDAYNYARAKITNCIVIGDAVDYQLTGTRRDSSRTGVYATIDAYKAAEADTKADLAAFGSEYWDTSSGFPVFAANGN